MRVYGQDRFLSLLEFQLIFSVSDFIKTIPISKKVLTDNLRALEEDGLIEREVFAEVPPRVEYSLSPLGMSLRPILDAMMEWGTEYKGSLQ